MGHPPIRGTITTLLSAGALPQRGGPQLGRGMVGLEAGPGPPAQVRSLLPALLCLPGGPPSRPSAEALQAAPGPQSAGAVVIIAILSVLLAVLLTALLALLIYTW